MKRTHLIAVLVGVIAVGLFTADALAFCNSSTGTFVQRDPGPGGMMAASRVGAMRPPVAGQFVPRDQYSDGMNLHQYARSNPGNMVDWNGSQAAPPSSQPVPANGDYIVIDLGPYAGEGIYGGNTEVVFNANSIGLTSEGCGGGQYQIVLTGWYGEASYRWHDAANKAHELRHVEIGRQGWNDLWGYAQTHLGVCYCPDVAACWRDAIVAKREAAFASQLAQQWRFDADDYGDRVPGVKDHARQAAAAAAAAKKKFDEINKKCSQMSKG